MIRRQLWLCSLVTGLAMIAAACGDDDAGGSTAVPLFTRTPETASPTPAPTSVPTTEAPSASENATSTASPTPSPTAPPSATPHVVVTASPDEPVASTAFIPADQLPLAVMTNGEGASFSLPIEVPGRNEYNIGLSGRLELGERGMLFWYAQPTTQSFWMKDTHYDLSIAFVDGDATIVAILDMEAESLEIRAPGHEYRYAIEAPLGWFAERGIEAGDQAVLDFEIPDFLLG